MKKFKNKIVGVIETVTNEFVIKQYEKRPDLYELVKEPTKKSK